MYAYYINKSDTKTRYACVVITSYNNTTERRLKRYIHRRNELRQLWRTPYTLEK